MLKCVIVDDESMAADLLESYIKKTDDIELSGRWTDPIEALNAINTIKPDLVFLDIEMPGMSGLEMSRAINARTMVIFTTAYSQYAVESYEVEAVDYLLKPIRYSKFVTAINKARSRQQSVTGSCTFIRSSGGLVRVEYAEILYIEALKDYVTIYLKNGTELSTQITMTQMLENLGNRQFMRVHRSYIVNIDAIESITNAKDIIIGGRFIPVAKQYKEALLSRVTSL